MPTNKPLEEAEMRKKIAAMIQKGQLEFETENNGQVIFYTDYYQWDDELFHSNPEDLEDSDFVDPESDYDLENEDNEDDDEDDEDEEEDE